MEWVFSMVGVLAGLASLYATWRGGRSVPGTTLQTSFHWSLAAAVLLCAAWIFARAMPEQRNAVDLVWYVSAIAALCPPIAVLGARRPGVRTWTWFVLWPLVAVMGWPAITILGAGGHLGRLQLETPALMGFLLVMLMGCGNYLGTRKTGTALLTMLGTMLILAPISTRFGDANPQLPRTIGYFCCATAPWLSSLTFSREPPGFDRLWQDFRNTFGIVWAHRVAERFNQQMVQEGFEPCLTPGGFAWPSAPDQTRHARAEHTLRWLLRRFVDPEWIDARLGSTTGGPVD